jgi:hypothetical protein
MVWTREQANQTVAKAAHDCGIVSQDGRAYTPIRKCVNIILAFLKKQGISIASCGASFPGPPEFPDNPGP